MYGITKTKARCENDKILFSHGTSYPPFMPHKLHTHERCEIFCVFRGNGFYVTEGVRHVFERGRIFLMRPGEMHLAELIGDEPRESLAFHFDPSIVDGIDPERRLLTPFFDRPLGTNNVYDHSALASTEIYSLFQQMQEIGNDNYENCAHCSALLLSVLSELKRLFDAKQYAQPNSKFSTIQSLVHYVNQNLTSDLSIDALCEKFHLSRAQLDRSFKHHTGSTVWAYITAKRLLLTKEYIADGMHATEAAAACGFQEYSTFFRAYRKKFGSSPTTPK